MTLNLHAWTTVGCAAALSWAVPLAAQTPCPPCADSILAAGWRAYRADSTAKAKERFEAAQRLCPQNADGWVGLGFTKLRLGDAKAADDCSLRCSAGMQPTPMHGKDEPGAASGWATLRRAIASGRRVLRFNPNNQEVRALLNAVAPEWEHPAPRKQERATELQLVARTRGRVFEVASGTTWRRFYVKGVNLGAALPGRYPSEFPADSAGYAGWLNTLARMNANTLRVYTILPPSFYRALRAWNLAHPDRLLWLIHGVWTESPPSHDFNEPSWKRSFEDEMHRVVDLLHGSATIEPRPGHAAGDYDADVSRWVLAYIIGREWEPFAVKAFNENAGGGYQGRYLQVNRLRPWTCGWPPSATRCSATRQRPTTRSDQSPIPTGLPSIHCTTRPSNQEGGGGLAAKVGTAIRGEPAGIRQRRGQPGCQPDPGHVREPGGLVRQLSRVSVLPRFHESRPRIQKSPLQ